MPALLTLDIAPATQAEIETLAATYQDYVYVAIQQDEAPLMYQSWLISQAAKWVQQIDEQDARIEALEDRIDSLVSQLKATEEARDQAGAARDKAQADAARAEAKYRQLSARVVTAKAMIDSNGFAGLTHAEKRGALKMLMASLSQCVAPDVELAFMRGDEIPF